MATNPEQDRGNTKAALEHAWAWFSLHASQRFQSVNFFLVATAFLLAAFVTAMNEKMHFLAGGIAVLSVFISYLFYQLELRIRSLIKAAEAAMEPLQDELAESLKIDNMRIVSHVEESANGEWKYSKVFRYLYFTTGVAFSLGLFYVTWAAASTTPGVTAFNVVQAVLGIFLVVVGYEMLFGLPQIEQQDKIQTVSRWSLIGLGVVCVLAGVAIICHFVFARL